MSGPTPRQIGLRLFHDGNYAAAVQQFKRALLQDRANGDLYSYLGAAYAELGEHGEAIAAFEEAARADPASARAHYNLGMAYLTVGRKKEAGDSLRTALALSPGHDKARETLEALERDLPTAAPPAGASGQSGPAAKPTHRLAGEVRPLGSGYRASDAAEPWGRPPPVRGRGRRPEQDRAAGSPTALVAGLRMGALYGVILFAIYAVFDRVILRLGWQGFSLIEGWDASAAAVVAAYVTFGVVMGALLGLIVAATGSTVPGMFASGALLGLIRLAGAARIEGTTGANVLQGLLVGAAYGVFTGWVIANAVAQALWRRRL